MDKSTLSNYGWVVIAVLVISVMIALATPFGSYIAKGVESTVNGLSDTMGNALNINLGKFTSNPPNLKHNDTVVKGATYTDVNDITYSEGEPFPVPQTGDTYSFEQYEYKYDRTYGWSVKAIPSETEVITYESPLVEINGNAITCTKNCFINFKNQFYLSENFEFPSTITDAQNTFQNAEGLTQLPDHFKIPDSVINGSGFFRNCINLKSLPPHFTFPKDATNLQAFFYRCLVLEKLPETAILPDNAERITSMFNGCFKLKQLPSNFRIPSKCTETYSMFVNCKSLEKLPDAFEIPAHVNNILGMFNYCENLTGTITINCASEDTKIDSLFASTTKPIIIKGTSPILEKIARIYDNVTIG